MPCALRTQRSHIHSQHSLIMIFFYNNQLGFLQLQGHPHIPSDQTEGTNHFDSHLKLISPVSQTICVTPHFFCFWFCTSCTDYLMADFKHSQIRQAEIESIDLLYLNVHCLVKFLCADLRFGLLRLSSVKKCPQGLSSS